MQRARHGISLASLEQISLCTQVENDDKSYRRSSPTPLARKMVDGEEDCASRLVITKG